MKMSKLIICALAVATVIPLPAMPTREETARVEPVVRKLMVPEWMALKSGKKTRGEVAEVALRLARESDTEAAKLLLMKGSFVLYVKDGQTDKAVETMNAIETTIADLPPQSVTNMIELALLGLPNVIRTRLYQRFDAAKAVVPSVKNRTTIQSIIDGMIKVPDHDYWLSETELTQGQWEAVMGYNLSAHKGVNLPVENVSRDDCDVFLEKLNQTKEVKASQFEFRLPERHEWAYAARTGCPTNILIKPNVLVSNLLEIAWLKENSDGQTHVVAAKAPNAWGYYDMVGNVHEWVTEGPESEKRGTRRGYSFRENLGQCRLGHFFFSSRNVRMDSCGIRLAAHIRTAAETCPDSY